jgi:hypothetical protein
MPAASSPGYQLQSETIMPETRSEPRSRVEQFLLALPRMPVFRQLIPQEAGIGWPLPRRKKEDGRLYVTIPFYGFRRAKDGKTDLFPLFATITVDWSTKIVVEYADLQYTGLCPRSDEPRSVGRFPHEAVSDLTVAQYRQAKSDLLAHYDQMLESLAAGAGVDAAFAARFSALFSKLLEPALEEQYRALAGKFVERFKPAL